jgi:putative RecB family exonuclease
MRTRDPKQDTLPGIDSSPVTFLSPSALDRYQHCPRLYRFLYVDGMWNRSRVTATQSFGTTIHAVLRDYFRLPVARRSLERLMELLRDNWIPEGYANREERQAERERATEALRAWHARADSTAVPYATEVDLKASWGDIVLKGRLDRVDTDGEGGLVVVDYKTGRRPVSQEAADSDSALTIYAALAERRLRRPVHRLVLDYVVAGTTVETERPPEVLAERLEAVLATAAKLRTDNEFVPRTGPWCSSCDLLGACPEGQREVGPA